MVLDDAVVHDRQPVAADVRMRIALGGCAVRRPACMGDAQRPGQLGLLRQLGQRRHATHAAQAMHAAVDHGQAGRVVAAVLELAQPFEQQRHDVAMRGCADDSAHVDCSCSRCFADDPTLRLLHRPLPTFDGHLLRARDGQLARRCITRDRAAGADRRALAHGDRRHQLAVGADESVVVDDGLVLVGAVVVAGDRACADIHVAADRRIAEIAQMVGLGALAQRRILGFDEVADVRVRRRARCPGAGARKVRRAHARRCAHRRYGRTAEPALPPRCARL